jgi:hypothetical protein
MAPVRQLAASIPKRMMEQREKASRRDETDASVAPDERRRERVEPLLRDEQLPTYDGASHHTPSSRRSFQVPAGNTTARNPALSCSHASR